MSKSAKINLERTGFSALLGQGTFSCPPHQKWNRLKFLRFSIAEIQPNSKKNRQISLHGFQVGSQK